MAYYSGINGALYLDDVKAAAVRNWTFAAGVQTLDTTNLGDTDRTMVAGLRSSSGTCTVMYHDGGSAAGLINSVVKSRTSATDAGNAAAPQRFKIKLMLDDGSVKGKYIEGKVNLTSVAMSMAQGEVFSAMCTFEFNGAPTESTL